MQCVLQQERIPGPCGDGFFPQTSFLRTASVHQSVRPSGHSIQLVTGSQGNAMLTRSGMILGFQSIAHGHAHSVA